MVVNKFPSSIFHLPFSKKLAPRTQHLEPNLGFSLVELLIVVAVMGILSTFAVNTFSGMQERARDAKRKVDLHNLRSAILLYGQDHPSDPLGVYPYGCDVWCYSNSGSWVTLQARLVPNYIKELPKDPNQSSTGVPWGGAYTYAYWNGTWRGLGFLLAARLENANDPAGGNIAYGDSGQYPDIPQAQVYYLTVP